MGLVELIIFILKTKKKESNELFQLKCWREIMKRLVSLLLIKRKIDYLMQNIFQILFEYLYLNILFLHSFFFQIIFIFLFFLFTLFLVGNVCAIYFFFYFFFNLAFKCIPTN